MSWIEQDEFLKYCEKGEDFIRIQDTRYPNGDLCFILDDNSYIRLYNCSEGYYFGVSITSIADAKNLYGILTDKDMTEL